MLDLTLEAGIPNDKIDGKHIVSLPHHDAILVDRVDDGLDDEIDGIADFAMRLREVDHSCSVGQENEGSETVIRIGAKGEQS